MESSAHPGDKEKRTSGPKARRPSAAFALGPTKQQQQIRYMPTYRLEPKVPLNIEICENIIQEVMERALMDYQYSQKQTLGLCTQLSEEIKNRIKAKNFDRYRYICIVTIGEKVMQGFCAMTNFLWDATKDGYLKYVYDTPNFFAIVVLYYIYYD